MINLKKKLVEREVEVVKKEMKQVAVWIDTETGREYSEHGLKVKILNQIEYDGNTTLQDIAKYHACKTDSRALISRTQGTDYVKLYKAIEPHIALLKETDLI